MLRKLLLTSTFCAISLTALAHDQWADGTPVPAWVKTACCGPHDVHHLKPSQVHEIQCPSGGLCYQIDGYPWPVSWKQATPSQDGDYWAFYSENENSCAQERTDCTPLEQSHPSAMRCFFVPMDF